MILIVLSLRIISPLITFLIFIFSSHTTIYFIYEVTDNLHLTNQTKPALHHLQDPNDIIRSKFIQFCEKFKPVSSNNNHQILVTVTSHQSW